MTPPLTPETLDAILTPSKVKTISTDAKAGLYGPIENLQALIALAKSHEALRDQIVAALLGAADFERKFERSQRRWGNLKTRVKSEIADFESATLNPQQRSQYANGVARLRWVIREMEKSPDVLAEAAPEPVAALQGRTWQPMESAPKDGSRILAMWNGRPEVIYWHATSGPNGRPWANWLPESRHAAVNYKPTAWQPLPPAPPQAQETT